MKSFRFCSYFFFTLIAISGFFTACKAQKPFGESLLELYETIEMPSVKGRIDHMDINVKNQILYVAALGNNSVEEVDLNSGKIIHSIEGLREPQGVAYIPQHHEIIVANAGNGDCYFYNANSFDKIATVHLASDADDIRYDSSEKKIYVGYGDGGIAVIDADTRKLTADIKLPAHPESFQIDKDLNLLFVNLPDAHMVAAIDLTQFRVINKWIRNTPTANFPMALDAMNHRLYIGYRHPANLVVLDGKTGKEISMISMAGDADDLYYDDKTREIFVSGGDGHINIFQWQSIGAYRQIANIATRSGARTSLLVPQLRYFVLAARAESSKDASIMVYKISH